MRRIALFGGAIVAGVGLAFALFQYQIANEQRWGPLPQQQIPPGPREKLPPLIHETTLLRELPRQALMISIVQECGQSLRDPSIDFSGKSAELPFICKRERTGVTLFDPTGKEVRKIAYSVPAMEKAIANFAIAAENVEALCETEYTDLLKSTGLNKVASPDPSAAELPAAVEPLLMRIDAQSAFLAGRMLHDEIALHGESLDRLVGLARAYANLGEATRYLYSPHSAVFFARAALYSERAARLYPEDARSHAARGYVYTLLTFSTEGSKAFARAHEVAAGTALPDWAQLAEDLNFFRTRELFDRADSSAAGSLAGYFAMLTVEHSDLQNIVLKMAGLALQQNPGALRAINIMCDNSGVALNHETTVELTQAQFRRLALLAEDETVPSSVRAAATEAAAQKFAAPAVLNLFARMDEVPPAGGQMLPWSVLASISRDELFVSGFRRLYFTDRMLRVNTQQRFDAWWPLLKDHRYAPAFAGYDASGKIGSAEARKRVRDLSRIDVVQRMKWVHEYVSRMNLQPRQKPDPKWKEIYEYEDDGTAWDKLQVISAHRELGDGIFMVQMIKGEIAEQIKVTQPDNPAALAELITSRWPTMRDRAGEIELRMGGHPQVALALAERYNAENRHADALRLLEKIIVISPDPVTYKALSNAYLAMGDEQKWLDIIEKYLAETPDFGLDHAATRTRMAYAMLRRDRKPEAVKFAALAARSYSQWSLKAYAICLSETGDFEKAEEIIKATQQRYPAGIAWYLWCQTYGKGDLPAARQASQAFIARAEKDDDADDLYTAAIYYQLERQPQKARDCWAKGLDAGSNVYVQLQLAMLDLELGKPDEIDIDRLTQSAQEIKFTHNLAPIAEETTQVKDQPLAMYRATLAEIGRCLEFAHAVPLRTGAIEIVLNATDSDNRVDCAYFLGRVCELRGKTEDAKWWYRTALDTGHWTAACRPLAAAALRQLEHPQAGN